MGEAIANFVESTGFAMIANDPKVLIMVFISLDVSCHRKEV